MLLPVVFYGRFSSDNQREESIDAQLRASREYANQNGYIIIREYVDRAKSGKTSNRPDFLRMIEDSKKGDFKYVLVHKLDRFSRNKYDSAIFKQKLQQRGVKVLSVIERLDDSPESKMMESVIEGFSQFYIENLKREVLKGLKENAYNGMHNGGKPPIGYDVGTDKKYIINEFEAEAVKLIFKMYTDGEGYSDIIEVLNQKGYKTKNGNSFSKNSIYSIVTNEKYTGDYIYNKRSAEDVFAKRNNHKYKDDADIIRVEGAVPQIIDRETFLKASQICKSRQKVKAKNSAISNYLLSGLVVCGECGAAMTGNRRKSGKGFLFESYRCSGKSRKFTDCSNHEIKKDAIEGYIMYELEKYVLDSQRIKQLVVEINEMINEHNKINLSEIKPLKIRIASVQNKIRNIVTAIENGVDKETMYQRLVELKVDKQDCEEKLSRISNVEDLALIEENDVRSIFKQYRDELNEKKSSSLKKIFGELVFEVRVYKDHIEVKFNVVFSLEIRYKNMYFINKIVQRKEISNRMYL